NVTLSGAGSTFSKFDTVASNSGTIWITDARSFSTSASGMNNTGTIMVGGGISGSILTINGAISQLPATTLTGGTWIVLAGGNMTFSSGSDIATNAATVILNGAGSNFPRINNISANQGLFTITGGRAFTTAGAFSNSGTTVIGTSSALKIAASL